MLECTGLWIEHSIPNNLKKKSVISYDCFLQWHEAKQYESDNYLKIRMRYIYFKDKKLNNNNEVKDLEKITSDN